MFWFKDKKRLASLLKIKKKVVVFHRDADGTTSAALMLRCFPGEHLPVESPGIDNEVIESIEKKDPELVVFLDLPVDRDIDDIREMEKRFKILVIDHHIVENDINSDQTLFINPCLQKKGVYLPAAYLVYRVLEEIGKPVKGLGWISAIGVIGDYGFKECEDLLDEVKKRKPEYLKGHPRESRLGLAGDLISHAITIAEDKGVEKALHSLLKAKSFEEFETTKELVSWKGKVEKEVEKVVNSFEEEKESHPTKKAAFFEMKSKYSITSTVATILSEKNPDTILVIKRDVDDGYKVSFRNQSGRVDLNKLVNKTCKGIGTGGGHMRAAGAFVTDWETFKKRFLEALPKVKN